MRSFSRRSFIKLTGATAATVAAAAGTRSLLDTSIAAPMSAAVAQAAPALEEKWVRTTCALCPSGCGLEVRVVDGRAVKVEGSAIHPVNQGVCCLRAQSSLEMLYSPERIERPRVRNGSKADAEATWREVSWDEALALVAGKLAGLRDAGQAHTVAFLHSDTRGSMRATIERFMTAYGSPNAISMDSAGEQASRTAMFLSQGINGHPVYDLNNANYAMAFGGNLLESSRHVITALAAMAFMRRGRPQRGKFVAVHPRLSLTGVKADEWVPIRPGTYGALALGMANVIINSNLYDAQFVRDYTFGFEDFTDAQGVEHMGFKRLVLEHYPLEKVEFITGVPAADIARLAGEFATNRPAVAIVPLEADGLDLRAALAVHALNALVGSIDVKGGVLVQRFPDLAPWPDDPLPASTSGAASSFPYQPRVDDAATSSASPFEPPAPEALAARLASNDPYPVNALFLYNANPVYESPADGKMAEALLKIPFVVSFASTLSESAAHADVILPASTFLEIWGDDFVEGVGYPGASIRRPVVDPVHDTRNPGDVLLALAAALGGVTAQALPFADYKTLCEHRLSAIDTDWAKFDENGVWSEMVYFHAQPGSKAWDNVAGRDRLNAPKDGRFDFFSREMLAVMDGSRDAAAVDLACLPGFDAPAEALTTTEYPFMLVTQGLITQPRAWSGIVPTLQESYGLQSNMKWNTWVEISPSAAAPLGLADHDRVWIESPLGRVQAVVRLYKGLWPNAVYLPPGQGHRTEVSWGRGSAAPVLVGENVNRLLASRGVTRVRIVKI